MDQGGAASCLTSPAQVAARRPARSEPLRVGTQLVIGGALLLAVAGGAVTYHQHQIDGEAAAAVRRGASADPGRGRPGRARHDPRADRGGRLDARAPGGRHRRAELGQDRRDRVHAGRAGRGGRRPDPPRRPGRAGRGRRGAGDAARGRAGARPGAQAPDQQHRRPGDRRRAGGRLSRRRRQARCGAKAACRPHRARAVRGRRRHSRHRHRRPGRRRDRADHPRRPRRDRDRVQRAGDLLRPGAAGSARRGHQHRLSRAGRSPARSPPSTAGSARCRAPSGCAPCCPIPISSCRPACSCMSASCSRSGPPC